MHDSFPLIALHTFLPRHTLRSNYRYFLWLCYRYPYPSRCYSISSRSSAITGWSVPSSHSESNPNHTYSIQVSVQFLYMYLFVIICLTVLIEELTNFYIVRLNSAHFFMTNSIKRTSETAFSGVVQVANKWILQIVCLQFTKVRNQKQFQVKKENLDVENNIVYHCTVAQW